MNMRSLRGPLMLTTSIFVLWQAAFWMVGDMALRSPLSTLLYSSDLLSRESFYPHLIETCTAFGAAITIAVASARRVVEASVTGVGVAGASKLCATAVSRISAPAHLEP